MADISQGESTGEIPGTSSGQGARDYDVSQPPAATHSDATDLDDVISADGSASLTVDSLEEEREDDYDDEEEEEEEDSLHSGEDQKNLDSSGVHTMPSEDGSNLSDTGSESFYLHHPHKDGGAASGTRNKQKKKGKLSELTVHTPDKTQTKQGGKKLNRSSASKRSATLSDHATNQGFEGRAERRRADDTTGAGQDRGLGLSDTSQSLDSLTSAGELSAAISGAPSASASVSAPEEHATNDSRDVEIGDQSFQKGKHAVGQDDSCDRDDVREVAVKHENDVSENVEKNYPEPGGEGSAGTTTRADRSNLGLLLKDSQNLNKESSSDPSSVSPCHSAASASPAKHSSSASSTPKKSGNSTPSPKPSPSDPPTPTHLRSGIPIARKKSDQSAVGSQGGSGRSTPKLGSPGHRITTSHPSSPAHRDGNPQITSHPSSPAHHRDGNDPQPSSHVTVRRSLTLNSADLPSEKQRLRSSQARSPQKDGHSPGEPLSPVSPSHAVSPRGTSPSNSSVSELATLSPAAVRRSLTLNSADWSNGERSSSDRRKFSLPSGLSHSLSRAFRSHQAKDFPQSQSTAKSRQEQAQPPNAAKSPSTADQPQQEQKPLNQRPSPTNSQSSPAKSPTHNSEGQFSRRSPNSQDVSKSLRRSQSVSKSAGASPSKSASHALGSPSTSPGRNSPASFPHSPVKGSVMGNRLRRSASQSETISSAGVTSGCCTGVPNVNRENLTSRLRFEKHHGDHHNHLDHAHLDNNSHLEPAYLESADGYLTPTQRKDLMIKELRQHVRQLNKQLMDREKQEEILKEEFERQKEQLRKELQAELEESRKVAAAAEQEVTSLRESHDQSVKTVATLQKQIQDVTKEMTDKLSQAEEIFLEMYNKGRESAIFEREEELELQKKGGRSADATELELRTKLEKTQAELAKWQTIQRHQSYHSAPIPATEAETTLRFLKDSVFHFLTSVDSKSGDEHLRAIVRILRFSDIQREKIALTVIHKRNKTGW